MYHPSTATSVDDKLQIDAHVCTAVPSDENFPVKVLFIVDTSDSQIVTDPNKLRATAVTNVLQRFQGNPSVEFAVIAFDSDIAPLTFDANGVPAFTNTPDIASIATRVAQSDRSTDYQGVLSAAYTLLTNDMQSTKRNSPADLPRSKYVVIFLTDGTPDPQCSATPPNPPNKDIACVLPRDQWAQDFQNYYPQLQIGVDYNQPYQIYGQVDAIVSLQDIYHVGEVRFHSMFLFDPAAFARQMALGLDFGLDEAAGRDLLTNMAMHGHGTFTEFNQASNITFFNVDYTAIKATNSLAMLFGWNENTWLNGMGLEVDTDGDGLSDTTETGDKYCVGLNPACSTPRDTDGDGYSDLLEQLNMQAGFDPRDPKKPATPCMDKQDTDGDGLRDCEEEFLSTDPRLFDTDADRIPDYIEVRAGLNPLDPSDAFADSNHNGVRNLDELRAHLNPLTAGPPSGESNDDQYVNEINGSQQMDDGRICYDLTIRNIRLMTTGAGTMSPRGNNRVYFYFTEAPLDLPGSGGNLHIGCVNARYVDGVLKNPPSGKVELDDTNFKLAAQFNPNKDCVDYTNLGPQPVDGGAGD